MAIGIQGYICDTLSDMALALLGAMSALLLLTTYHNGLLNKYVGGTSDLLFMEDRHVQCKEKWRAPD